MVSLIKNCCLNSLRDNLFNGANISKVELYEYEHNNAASRTNLDISFNSKRIDTITDTGIRTILKRHLSLYDEVKGNSVNEHPELAFSPDGIDELNKNILQLNNGKYHKPIYKVRTYETIGNKFKVGYTGSKADKYVEAAKGTNLFFAIYQDENGKRTYETIPLNIAIERRKQGLCPAPEINDNGISLLFLLSPNDLVYVPTPEEMESKQIDWSDKRKVTGRVYKMVSSTGPQCFFVPAFISIPIMQTRELGANNKAERAWTGEMIKEVCLKMIVDRLGNVK